jgi:hypothetical protein
MYFEVGRASGGIDDRTQHSSEEAYLRRRPATCGRQRVIIDDKIARFTQLELAAIGQGDDGMTAGPGDDSIADIDRRSGSARRDSCGALNLHHAGGG